ncbi:MAG: HAMP domain-containing histidine kinase [Candidatus Thermoplasmatota archaeon]|jgi:signal transduction histidine kinase|nr:HAMP domain-containing histidine kinase [Candidatus Thermoplasmatota archaeon]
MREPFELKNYIMGHIHIKLTLLFLLVGLVAPGIGIGYFYLIANSFLLENSEFFVQQRMLLNASALLIIILIAVNTMLIGFFIISRSFSKPIHDLNKAAQELEKGNFKIQTNIKTNDELTQLSDALNRSALALSKMEEERNNLDRSKSEFLSITSHELRTPITPLKAQLQMLQQEYFGKLTDKQKESLTIILRNAERLNKIIEDFLEISRIEAARLKFAFRKTDLHETIKETIEFMTGFAKEKNISLASLPNQLPIIEIDPDRISQVLRNLVHNAIKFSPQNSTIEINAVLQNDHILFSVKDQGVGLSTEDQIRVFEPFYQVEGSLSRNYGGTGLGLTICRGIIEAQKGKIWVESKLNVGSTFYFTIPLTPVYDIEPIKVLFSQKGELEKKIRNELINTLGPMGDIEFNELKNKHSLNREDLTEYVILLEKQRILRHTHANDLKINIGKIFGQENRKDENKQINNEERGEPKVR